MAGVQYIMARVQEIIDSARYCIVLVPVPMDVIIILLTISLMGDGKVIVACGMTILIQDPGLV